MIKVAIGDLVILEESTKTKSNVLLVRSQETIKTFDLDSFLIYVPNESIAIVLQTELSSCVTNAGFVKILCREEVCFVHTSDIAKKIAGLGTNNA